MLQGTWPSALNIQEHEIEHGRMFTMMDDLLSNNVCVIGTDIVHVMSLAPLEAAPDVRLNDLKDMAQVDRSIGVGQSAGNQHFSPG